MSITSIKEQDLHKFTKDLIDAAVKIDRPNREKICNFVLNLATNGGKRMEAALEAGYGSNKDEAGKKVASSKAATLLENDEIFSLYDKIFALRFTSTIFAKLLEKEHRIALLYQVFFHCYEEKTHVSVSAFQEISRLKGDYEDKGDSDIGKLLARLDELNQKDKMYEAFMNFHKLPKDAPPDKERLN